MAHNCIDWSAVPPARKVPHLVLSRGDDHVYTVVPDEFKTLQQIARKEFNLGDADIQVFSSCVNLCNGLPARITESAWERMRDYIGCATVEVIAPRVVQAQVQLPQEEPQPERPDNVNVADEPDPGVPMNTDENNEAKHAPEPVSEQGVMSSNAGVHHRPITPEPEEDDVGPASPRKSRRRRLVVSEDEGDDESERDHARSQGSEREIKQERHSDCYSQTEADQPDRPIKQEKRDTESPTHSQPQASENLKLMIRVAHRPTRQESKFTTKSTTKVNKVLTGACKSFGLDPSHATLYLIVSMEDEDGEVENLFPCDKNDTIARAGAEHTTESRFLLKMAGEA